MDWFRYHHGTPQDSKLTMLAKKIGVRRCEMTAVWDELMDYASRSVTRGHIGGIDLEVIAFVQEIPIDNVKAIYDILAEKKIIIDGILTAWEKRQPKREDEGAAQRQREKRARDKPGQKSQKNTHAHEMSRNVTTEEIREDREDKKERKAPITNQNTKTPPLPPPREESGVLKNGFGSWDVKQHLNEKAIAMARKNAPEWDIYYLMTVYNQGIPKRGAPTHPNSAFPAWCLKYTKGHPPGYSGNSNTKESFCN